MDESGPFEPGDRIGSYVVEDILGSGGVGVVYRCRHAHFGRTAAVNVPLQEDFTDRWRRGAGLLAGLNHPNIVQVYDMGDEGGIPYLALQYIEGEQLSTLAKQGGVADVRVLLRIMASIAGALQHAHGQGVLHKGIAPPNIVIAPSGEPVLVGFSLAGSEGFEGETPAGKLIGIPYFMSPEHWENRCRPVSDIWSLGVVMYTVISGVRPFPGSTPPEVMARVTSPDPVDLSPLAGKVPEYVADIVGRCLRRDPDERFQSGDDLRHALEAAIDFVERSETMTAVMPLPADGQTILTHVEVRETDLPGSFRPYRVGEYVGGGSFGDVFRATDDLSGRDVALKILKREHVSDEQAVARFRREATLLSRLSHPNVVRVHNFGRYGSTFFVAMELLGGGTLAEVIAERGPLGPGEAARLLAPALDGLAALHDSGIVHRDLKPSNIAVDGGRIVVFDLGIAHAADLMTLTMTGAFIGSPRYASPEQATARPVSGATDVYAAGVVLYEALTGHTPHEGDSTFGVLTMIASEPPVPITEHRDDLPAELVELLDTMIEKAPEDRPTAREAAGVLTRFSEGV